MLCFKNNFGVSTFLQNLIQEASGLAQKKNPTHKTQPKKKHKNSTVTNPALSDFFNKNIFWSKKFEDRVRSYSCILNHK